MVNIERKRRINSVNLGEGLPLLDIVSPWEVRGEDPKRDVEAWETESLAWIHAVRQKEQRARRGQLPRPLSRGAAERLAARYGLKLAKRTAVG